MRPVRDGWTTVVALLAARSLPLCWHHSPFASTHVSTQLHAYALPHADANAEPHAEANALSDTRASTEHRANSRARTCGLRGSARK